jgi:phosphoribosylformimino-5-aminoimidazole carboxamide ribotide isomerase
MRLIPAIDLKAGRCVRLFQGDFNTETQYPVEPHELLSRYRGLGADWLHIVDLDGARSGALGNRSIVVALATQKAVKLQVGGGLRDTSTLSQMFDANVSRVVVGSAAVTHPDLVRSWFHQFGADRITLAFDVRFDGQGIPRLATHGWREQSGVSLWDAIGNFYAAGLKHVLCTDVNRDGALSGPNLALYKEAAERCPGIEWQASGGIRDAADLHALAAVGAAAAISGKALLEQRIPIEELRPFLPNA